MSPFNDFLVLNLSETDVPLLSPPENRKAEIYLCFEKETLAQYGLCYSVLSICILFNQY